MGRLEVCYCIIIVCLLGATAIVAKTREDEEPAGKVASGALPAQIEGRSFSLRSSVTIIDMQADDKSNLPLNSWSKMHESYSVEQERARLTFKTVGPSKSNPLKQALEMGTFYLDAKSNKILLHKALRSACVESSMDEIREKLAISFFNELELDEMVADHYIVGPARLLFFIARHQDKLKLKSLELPVFVRNIKTLRYTLDFLVDRFRKPINFSVYYSEAAALLDPQSLPLEVIVQTDKQVIIIDYSQLELLSPNTPTVVSQSGDGGTNLAMLKNGATTLDPFAYPLFSDCSKSIAAKSIPLFEDKPANLVKFSFRGKLKFLLSTETGAVNVKMNTFVAYDGALESLRFDMATPQRSGVRRQIFNFKLNRMYHSVERVAGSDTFLDKTLNLSMESAEPDDLDAISKTTQCMVARLLPLQAEKSISLGKLLVGADRFVYMGKAQVRGMPALVYEASDASMPFWLDQPMEYNYAGQSRLRQPERGARETQGNSTSGLTIILYLAEQEANHPLLLIEVNSLKLRKQTVVVHDFVWSLAHQAPNGDRASELFSLEDLCSAGMGRNHYARVEMMLLPDKSIPTGALNASSAFLASKNSRELALLASLQRDIQIPATMIYDLESRLMKPPPRATDANLQQPSYLAASFRVAKHTDRLAELVYLGQGRFNALYPGRRISQFCRSFQACFFLAAHRRANVYFAYNLDRRICSIDLEPIVGPSQMVDEYPPSFTMDPKESMEIFRVRHVVDPIMSTAVNTWLEDNTNFKHRFQLIGKPMDLFQGDGNVTAFKIKSIHLDDRDYKASIATDVDAGGDDEEDGNNSNNKYQPKTNRFKGFGLPEASSNSRRVAPVSLQTANWSPLTSYLEDASSTMTLEQCHAACLSDPDCQSFSLCIRDMEAQCVVSSVSLKSARVAKQLAKLAATSANKSGTRQQTKQVQIFLDNENKQPIQLIQRTNCDLYGKIYLDLFDRPMEIKQTFNNRRVYAVNSEEECAKLCVERNIDVLRQDVGRASESYSTFASEAPLLSPADDHESLLELLESHRRSAAQLCRAFLYWDRVELEIRGRVFAESVRTRVIGADRVDFESIDGYCAVGDRISKREEEELIRAGKHDSGASNDYIASQIHKFKADIFYERQHGIRLKASHLTQDEHRAYVRAKRRAPEATEQTYAQLRTLILLGDNFQDMIHADVSKCAAICFLQSWGPWPACRSFSIAVETKNNRTLTNCYLNSITLHQAISTQRFDLIDDSAKHQSWHYEPRPGFAASEGKLSENLHWIESGLLVSGHGKLGFLIGPAGEILIFLLAIGSGLALSHYLGLALLQLINRRQRILSDKEILVRRRPTIIEFSNQVTAEGFIQGE